MLIIVLFSFVLGIIQALNNKASGVWLIVYNVISFLFICIEVLYFTDYPTNKNIETFIIYFTVIPFSYVVANVCEQAAKESLNFE